MRWKPVFLDSRDTIDASSLAGALRRNRAMAVIGDDGAISAVAPTNGQSAAAMMSSPAAAAASAAANAAAEAAKSYTPAPAPVAPSGPTAGQTFWKDVFPNLLNAGASVANTALRHGRPETLPAPVPKPRPSWLAQHRVALAVGGVGLGLVGVVALGLRRGRR